MPMMTQIWDADADEPRTLPNGWGRWHLNVISDAMALEGHDGGWPGEFTFTQEHTYTDSEDGEIFVLRPGDRFVSFR